MTRVGHYCRGNGRYGARMLVHWDCRYPSRGWDWLRQGWDDVVFDEEQETWSRQSLKYVVCRCRRTHAHTRALLQGAIGRTPKQGQRRYGTRGYITNYNIFMPLSMHSGRPKNSAGEIRFESTTPLAPWGTRPVPLAVPLPTGAA